MNSNTHPEKSTTETVEQFGARCERWHEYAHGDRALSLSALIRTADDARLFAELICADLVCGGVDASTLQYWHGQVTRWDRPAEFDDVGAAFDTLDGELDAARKYHGEKHWALARASMLVRVLEHAYNRCVAIPRYARMNGEVSR